MFSIRSVLAVLGVVYRNKSLVLFYITFIEQEKQRYYKRYGISINGEKKSMGKSLLAKLILCHTFHHKDLRRYMNERK